MSTAVCASLIAVALSAAFLSFAALVALSVSFVASSAALATSSKLSVTEANCDSMDSKTFASFLPDSVVISAVSIRFLNSALVFGISSTPASLNTEVMLLQTFAVFSSLE